ncbi:T9SS type A sorting domain-containing protein [Roseimarinus sediminis]|uniref:T9SS type A sorting domain-containing protein n=1 Tax=Roseimarinus sediminis TaxID=1610899 RepID=UPI003D1D2224
MTFFKLFLVSIFFGLSAASFSQSDSLILIGDLANDLGKSVCTTSNGDLILLAEVQKSRFSQRTSYYARFKKNGSMLWQHTYQSEHAMEANHITPLKNGNFALTGTCFGERSLDMHVLIIDDDGKIVSDMRIDNGGVDKGYKSIETRNGQLITLGFAENKSPLLDLFISCHSSEGKTLWRKAIGSNIYDYAFDVLEAENGDLLLCGTLGGFYYRTGWEYRNHDAQFLIYRLDKNGEVLFSKDWGGNGHDEIKRIVADPRGGFFLFGSTQYNDSLSFDMFLQKTDDDFNVLWSKSFGGVLWDKGNDLLLSNNNELYLIGTSQSEGSESGADMLLIKCDLSGEVLWEKRLGSAGSDEGVALAGDSSGDIIITGSVSAGQQLKQAAVALFSSEGKQKAFDKLQIKKMNETKVYPNPASSYLHIEIDPLYKGPFTFQLYNFSGQVVKSINIEAVPFTCTDLELSNGVYLYRISNQSELIHSGQLMLNTDFLN